MSSNSQLKFPNVTVCPPRDTYLNLNYDIMKSENMNIDQETRRELFDFALDCFQDAFYEEMMKNISKLEDPDRYFNWYHGYTDIQIPFFNHINDEFWYRFHSTATSGNISTKYFGDQFDAEKVDVGMLNLYMSITVPQSIKGDKNTVIMINLDKISLKDGYESILMPAFGTIDKDTKHYSQNYSGQYFTNIPNNMLFISYGRIVADTAKMKLDKVPGLRLTWMYNKEVEKVSMFQMMPKTQNFVR